jgi:hypothetical protein
MLRNYGHVLFNSKMQATMQEMNSMELSVKYLIFCGT